MSEHVTGKQPYNEGVKRFSCESEITDNYPHEPASNSLVGLADMYHSSSLAIPMHAHLRKFV